MLPTNSDKEKIISNFCNATGIRKVTSYIKNKDTNEIRYYISPKSIYKKPRGWDNTEVGVFNHGKYPDLTEPNNFLKLIDVHWKLFGCLGHQYEIKNDESFPLNYIETRTKAINLCKSLGGGEMLDIYLQMLKTTEFKY